MLPCLICIIFWVSIDQVYCLLGNSYFYRSFRLQSSLRKSSIDVICLGEVLFDCIYDVDNPSAYKLFPGGAPANAACALSKLGLRTGFAGAVGDDENGNFLLKVLKEKGIDISLSKFVHSSFPTRVVMVARDPVTGEREFANFIDNKPTHSFADTQYSIPIESFQLYNPSALVMGTLGLAIDPTKSLMESIFTISDGRILFVVDINWREVFWAQEEYLIKKQIIEFVNNRADIVKLTDEEAVWLTGIENRQVALERPDLVFNYLKPKLGILVSAGELGNDAIYYIELLYYIQTL